MIEHTFVTMMMNFSANLLGLDNAAPAEVTLSIDGKNDACSKNIDTNFEFIGFGITGKSCASSTFII